MSYRPTGPQPWTDEYAQKKAAGLGCTVEYADEGTLQLDIDNEVDFTAFVEQLALLRDLKIGFDYIRWTCRPSRSGNHHVTVRLTDPLPMTIRILLQACLGSDRKRELLAYAGMLKGQEHPILLFRPKGEEA